MHHTSAGFIASINGWSNFDPVRLAIYISRVAVSRIYCCAVYGCKIWKAGYRQPICRSAVARRACSIRYHAPCMQCMLPGHSALYYIMCQYIARIASSTIMKSTAWILNWSKDGPNEIFRFYLVSSPVFSGFDRRQMRWEKICVTNLCDLCRVLSRLDEAIRLSDHPTAMCILAHFFSTAESCYKEECIPW